MYVATFAIAEASGLPLPEASPTGPQVADARSLLVLALPVVPVLALTLAIGRWVDRAPLSRLGFRPPSGVRGWLGQTLVPLALAGVLLALWRGLAGLGLGFQASRGPLVGDLGGAMGYAAGFLGAALFEEVVFRGYLYSTLRERFPWVHAAGISSVLFTLLHGGNPGVGTVALVNTFLLGLGLAMAREATGGLWWSTLFHAGWNFLLGCVLSLPLSGIRLGGFREVTVEGPTTLSGGSYGPEASWLLGLLLLLTVVGGAWRLGGVPEGTTEVPGG